MWVAVTYCIDSVWFSKECVGCAGDPSVHQDVPSIAFVYVGSNHLGV